VGPLLKSSLYSNVEAFLFLSPQVIPQIYIIFTLFIGSDLALTFILSLYF
jgi:hypothetical protein